MSRTDDSWAPNIAKLTFLLLTAALFAAVVYLLRNVLHAIILGVLFAGILMPLHDAILKYVSKVTVCTGRLFRNRLKALDSPGCRSFLAALLSVIVVFLLVVLPLVFLTNSVLQQGRSAIPSAMKWLEKDMPRKAGELIQKYDLQDKLEIIESSLQGIMPSDNTESREEPQPDNPDRVEKHEAQTAGEALYITRGIVNVVKFVLQGIGKYSFSLLSRAWLTVFNFFIMLFVMFHVFHDGKMIWEYLKSISPLGDEEQSRVAARIKDVTKAIFYSIFGTAAIQGLLAMLFFKIVGIPALFWGFILGLSSIIPFVGTSLVWIPTVVYLLMTGQIWKAVFIFITCGCMVSNVDSLIRPFLMKQGGKTGMSYLVLFFSILGGLQTFGLVGIIYGPLITGMCSICLLIFSTRFKTARLKEDISAGKVND